MNQRGFNPQLFFSNKKQLNSGDLIWLVVSNIFYFHPYLGEWSNLMAIFFNGLKPPTSYVQVNHPGCIRCQGQPIWTTVTEVSFSLSHLES